MKTIRLIINTLSMLFWMTVVAHADPITAAIGIIVKAVSAAGLFKAILGIAINVGLSLLQRARAKKEQERLARENSGVQITLQSGGAVPMSILFGNTATAGNLEYMGVWGAAGKTPNAYLHMVISLADVPINALTGIIVNGERRTIGSTPQMAGSDIVGYPVSGFSKGGQNYLWVHFYDGTQTGADPLMVHRFDSNDRPWTVDHIGRGIPYVVVVARFEENLFASGLPTMIFEVQGAKFYDISKDSTMGGSGAHRWNNQATWEYSENPVVVSYNVTRGIYYGSQWVYGGQNMPAALLPAASWIAGIAEANRLISLSGGGSERQFRCGGTIHTDVQPLEVIRDLMVACNGRFTELGGRFKTLIGAPGAAVASITDDSIIVTDSQTLDPFKSLEETFNGIHATYPERDQNWEMNDAPPRYYSAFEAVDDDRRLVADAVFNFVPFKIQVQRLMHAMIQDSRRMIIHQIYLPSWAYALEPNDVIAWTSAHNGYSAKKFLVAGITGAPTYNQLVHLIEIDPSDYDWSTDMQLPAPVGYVGPIAIPTQIATGFQVFPATFADGAGVDRRPSIEVRMDGDLDDVVGVRIMVRRAIFNDIVFDVTLPYGDPDLNANPKSIILNGTFIPNTDYEVSIKLIPVTPRFTDFTAWLPVTTPDVRLGMDDIYPIDVSDLIAELGDWMDWIGNSYRDVQAQLDSLDAHVASIALQANSDIQIVRQEMTSSYEDSVALFRSEIVVATGPDSALVRRMDQYDVSLAGKASVSALQTIGLVTTNVGGVITGVGTAITQITAQLPGKANITALQSIGIVTTDGGGAISGVGTAITGIQAQINGVTASSTFRAQAGYTPGAGYTSRIGLEARISAVGTYRAAGLYLDVNASQARVVVSADQFAVLAGGTLAALFDSGTAFIQTARIRNLTAVNIQAKSINANEILINGTIITDLIQANAVSRVATASLGSTVTLSTAYSNVVSVVASSAISGSRVLVWVFIKTSGPNTGGFGLYFRLLRNGSTLIQYPDVTSEPSNFATTFTFVDTPNVGNHTYLVQMRKTESPAATVVAATIAVMEVKR